MVSSASSRERWQNSSTASGSDSGGTGYWTSPLTLRRSRLVTRSLRLGQASRSFASSGAASTTCSKLSRTRSISRPAMCSASPSFAPTICATVSTTRAESRRGARPTQKTPFLKLGTSSVAEHRCHLFDFLLPAHKGGRRAWEVRVRDRLERREALRAELEDPHGLGEVLHPVLAQVRHFNVDQLPRRLR